MLCIAFICSSFSQNCLVNSSVVSITVIDMPGLQNPAAYGRITGASFEDLCQNYVLERMQQLYYRTLVKLPLKLFKEVRLSVRYRF
jgi:myosin heavy subunit